MAVEEQVDASKNRKGPAEALALLNRVDRLVAMKGKKVVEFDLKGARPTDEELLAVLMGPTGNLRAPTAIVGRTMLVGFHEEPYGKHLKG